MGERGIFTPLFKINLNIIIGMFAFLFYKIFSLFFIREHFNDLLIVKRIRPINNIYFSNS